MTEKRVRRRSSKNIKKSRTIVAKKTREFKKFEKQADKYIGSASRRINIALSNLFLFLVLAVVSYMLQNNLSNGLFISLFALLTIVFSFVSLAFFIILLVFLVLRFVKKEEEKVYPRPKKSRRRLTRRHRRR